ncbi:ribonuclease H-like YkuK family protein [Patescibacteria group bacterium]|nr:ribonuclease H-like YkuK family protein [Patescibacteria group bacterium]MBU4274917.1 ribonuclease H-like YkuK family protein [Patescibacteria group bacterium]MBU4367901.1 ribonuclease H-like YkuK family protein [Patescibacteria group bacterium]MBU4461922.1 ribonuclease H-like YkuK family protein [Patescibacteria group bacterium]MCG2699865.1 ribonuclease H-like YkuK family protein [Candidatus Parcubacteria bacterium]
MSKFEDGYFYNPSKGNLNFNGVIKEIFSYIREKPQSFYDIIVGCDSPSAEKVFFPVVIVVLRVGEGGRFFIKKISYPDNLSKKFSNWHQRILEEVLLSCDLALFLKEALAKELANHSNLTNYQFRYIHADVGEQGQTRDMVKEIVGLIKSNGFEAKIKPESFAASVVADRYT